MTELKVADQEPSQLALPSAIDIQDSISDKITQTQARFSVLDRVPIGVCVLQSDNVVLFWNSCLEQWTKISKNKILGTRISEHFQHLDQPKYANRLHQIFQGGPPTIFSSQLHKHLIPSPLPQGQWRVQHTTVTSVPALDEPGYYALLSIQDVTDLTCQIQDYKNLRDQALAEIKERQRAEDALRQSLLTNRALLEAMPDLMFRISKNGTFINFKAAKEHNWLLPHSEFLGKNLDEVLPADVAQLMLYWVRQALQTGKIQIFEFQLALNNPHDYEVRIVVSAEDEVIAIVRDITERKQVEADIRNALEKEKELSELKSRFVTMTSHEFRTPLSIISSSTGLLQDYSDRLDAQKKLKHLDRIQGAVKHMTQLLEDVLLLNRAEAGKQEFKPAPLDLKDFCCNLVEELQMSAAQHTIVFSTVNQDKEIVAYIDKKLLRQILTNLLSNAIKYSHPSSAVYFELSWEKNEAVFTVRDQGIGIPPEDRQRLFESFHRGKNVGNIPGTGLGLSIVKECLDLHNGRITVTSELGVGTTLKVNIPLN